MLVLLFGGGWLFGYAYRRRAAYLPKGHIISADMHGAETPGRPLFSRRYGLTGQPDYLIATRAGLIPVEIKSSKTPPHPYPSHVFQLAAYCLLVEEMEGHPPPHGFIRYPERTFQVPYTPDLRRALLETIEAMHADLGRAEVHRDHNETQRCLVCGYRGSCEEALV